MKLSRKLLPLLFLFSFGYSQHWKLSENEYLIRHKGKEYHSKLAKKDNSIAYYIYKIDANGEEEIIGDDADEIRDYKDLALASYYNFNKGKILLRIGHDLEMLRSSNTLYKTGIILNKTVEELSEVLSMELLGIGNKGFSLTNEIYKKYSQEVKEFSKNFMNEVIRDANKINSLEDLIKKLEEKIFNSTVIEAKKNIKELEAARKILLVSHTLSTGEVKLAERMISDGTIKGYSTSAFQDEYIRNIDQFGYQLTQVGSSMLKSFPKGKKAYDLVKRLGINGIEEIDSEALRKSFKKMREIQERVSLTMNLYKRNFDPNLEGSNANLLIKELSKKLEESLSNLEFIARSGAASIHTKPKPVGYYFVDIIKDSNSVIFKISGDKEMITYGSVDLKLNFKKINKNVEIKIDATPMYFDRNLFYNIGVTDGREISMYSQIISFAEYKLNDKNRYSGTISWTARLHRDGKLNIIRDGESFENYKNDYKFDVNNLSNWVIRIVAYTKSSEGANAGIRFSNIKVRRY